VAELADALDRESSAEEACRFNSCRSDQFVGAKDERVLGARMHHRESTGGPGKLRGALHPPRHSFTCPWLETVDTAGSNPVAERRAGSNPAGHTNMDTEC
jgi:hypothetical protein